MMRREFTVVTPTHFRRLRWAIQDTLAITQRDLRRVARKPDIFAGELLMPATFLLLFNYVFGGVIGAGAGVEYTQFLVPAIFVMTALIGATQTGAGLAEDLSKGVVDRFRSLPMSGVAVLAGRTVSDALRNVASISLVIALGYLIGFRFEVGVPAALVAIATAAALGFAVSWIVVLIATIVRSAEAVGMVNMLWLMPAWFASSMFVPTNTMPGGLEPIAHNQPVSVAVDAIRALSTSGFDAELVLKGFLWPLGLLLVFVPLSAFRYRRSA
jgi:ABC-2 type transport system permease protein/oleandomycin transport system permease protein